MMILDRIRKIKGARAFKIGVWTLAASSLVFSLLLLNAVYEIGRCGERVYTDVKSIPEREYALLLGTAKIVQGKYLNQYFQYRINAAAELYHAGKVRKIIVSGDNRRHGYNEPEDMRFALREAGIPDADIFLDYAGFRTLDSVVRAKNVFSVTNYTVISQKFHCERAIFIADAHELDVIGYAASEVSPRFRFKRFFREPLACLLAWFDVKILNSKPYFEK